MKALNVTAREMSVYLGGEVTPLRFDHNAMRQAEIYAETVMGGGRSLGYIAILTRAQRRVYLCLAALVYGAVVSAQMEDARRQRRGWAPMPPEMFDACVDLPQLLACADDVLHMAIEALPKAEPKNAEGQPEAAGGSSAES
ncbi:MAG: hypothetical protein IJ573_00720 [Clostridia bacterium]|nr:hypothetical protein [Clostridia bacterium]